MALIWLTLLPLSSCLLCSKATMVRPKNEAIGKIAQFFADPLRGAHPARHRASRPACRAAHKVRTGHQSQDRRGARAYDSPGIPLPGGRGDGFPIVSA